MKQSLFEILSNEKIAPNVFKLKLKGDMSCITTPGQFVNIKIDGTYLRRPISVCDLEEDVLTLVYKVVGKGTEILSNLTFGKLDLLTGLGNGYNLNLSGYNPVLLGGGVGIPPLYLLCKKLLEQNKKPTVILGFNKEEEIFLYDDFKKLGVEVIITTVDGSKGVKGFAVDGLKGLDYSYFYTCGPELMLKSVYKNTKTQGQLSFEERMGCGFGACMGCSCKTIYGNKRICKEGPVLLKEEILWKD